MTYDAVSRIRAAFDRLEAELNNFKLLVESEIESAEARGRQWAVENRGDDLPDS